ncbi:MAG: hypothetical protein EOO09_06955 [Chitinophagaceae bacterium]|nr:MAG: hypothetical protein EOO09_06955 [Chitinophagaceae bacterium]
MTLVLLFSCTPDEEAAPVTELPFFFVASLNGQLTGFAEGSTQGTSYGNNVFDSIAAPGPDSFHVYEGTRIFEILTDPRGSVTVSLVGIFDHQPGAEERAAMFSTGVKPFAFSDSTGQGGAAVHFTDGNGISWSTENHAQTDTSFRIELFTPLADPAATAVFQARFSCKLFNAGGDSMLLETGSVRGKILKP